MNIIAADVGGTKSHLVLTNAEAPDIVLGEARYNSTEFASFTPLLETFIAEYDIDTASTGVLCLALPGVVEDDVARLTNLPWTLEKKSLQQKFGFGLVHFINDFQASALGTLSLEETDVITLHDAEHDRQRMRVVIGAGTGLGVSWVDRYGARPVAHPTEGGHMDFAPVDDAQIALLQFLRKRHQHVSFERLLSGDGIVTLYEFQTGSPCREDAAWISRAAAQGDAEAAEALRMFVRIYGAFAGNLAMLFKPRGGIYITGGIGAKLREWMQGGDFMEAYRCKGRMQKVVERVAVRLVNNERVGVMGAVTEAVELQQAVNQP